MKVFVTGSSGFVGSHVARWLGRAGHDVFGFDRSEPLDGRFLTEFVAGDVANEELLTKHFRALQPGTVVHCAAITPGDDELSVASEILRVNVQSTMTLVELAARMPCQFVYMSSAGVYRDPAPGETLTEDSPLDDDGGLYAQTKLASERLAIWARRELAIRTTALRVGPVYGEFERPTASRARMSPIYRAVQLALDGETLSCNRWDVVFNWIHGDDVGAAVQAVLEADNPRQTYNLAGPPTSIRSTIESLQQVLPEAAVDWQGDSEPPSLLVRFPSRPMSSELISRDLGVEPGVGLAEGISRVVAACRSGTAQPTIQGDTN